MYINSRMALKMKTKTLPAIIKNITHELGNGNVTHHEPTEENKVGQSGLHTFIDDIMDVVELNVSVKLTHEEVRNLWKALHVLFLESEIKKME